MGNNYDDLLNDIIEKEIPISPPYEAPTRSEYHKRKFFSKKHLSKCLDPRTNYLCRHYHNVFGWIAANPTVDHFKQAMAEIRVSAIDEPTIGSPKYLYANTRIGENVFYSDISDKCDNTIAITGLKGSGKTFFINYILNNKSRDLFEKKIIWYRTDFSSIYRTYIYNNDRNTNINITLNQYLDAHIAYITLFYREHLTIFKNILDNKEKIKKCINQIYLDNNSSDTNMDDPDIVWKFYKKLYENLVSNRKNVFFSKNLAKSQKVSIHNLLLKQNKAIELSVLARVFLCSLKDLGYDILYIFDGIDNIDYFNDSKLYMTFLNQLASFCFSDAREPIYNGKKVICLRDETYHNLLSIPGYSYVTLSNEYTLKEIDIDMLIRKKLDPSISSQSKYFIESKRQAKDKIEEINRKEKEQSGLLEKSDPDKYIADLSSEFKQFGVNFIPFLIDTLNEILPEDALQEPINKNNLLDIVYNNNLRSFQCNFLNIYKYHRVFKENYDLKANKKMVLLEGLLLNGNIFLNTKSEKYIFGKVLPNIFWFNKEFSNGIWHSLTLYRILQYLINRKQEESVMVGEIVNLFNYNESIVERAIAYAIGHGLLSSTFSAETRQKYYALSRKGNLMLILPFLDINIFYYLALDTPLSSFALTRSKLIKIHGTNNTLWSEYISSSIVTSITFLRHIITQHNFENKALPTEQDSIRYAFPKIFPKIMLSQIKTSLIRLEKKNKKAHDELCLDIQSIAYDNDADDPYRIVI